MSQLMTQNAPFIFSKLTVVHTAPDPGSVIEAINHALAAMQKYYYCVADVR